MAQETHPEREAGPEAIGDEPQEELEPEESTPEQQVAALEERCAELNDKWLRAQADYQNLRRRALTDLEAGFKREVQPLLDELLLVLDFLDMALAAPVESADARHLAMGVQLTRAKLVQALAGSEVKEIPADGAFDPARHQATETRWAEGVDPGAIIEVIRKGYTWQGHVLRPTHVIVAAAEEQPMKDEDA